MKKLTREERRRRSQRWHLITYLLFLLLLLAWLGSYLIMTVEAELPAMHKPEPATQDGSLPGDDTPATTRCYLTEEEIEENENELIEAALLARSHKLEGDTGPAVKGDHIDIAVPTHDIALSLGVQTADIWWCEEGE